MVETKRVEATNDWTTRRMRPCKWTKSKLYETFGLTDGNDLHHLYFSPDGELIGSALIDGSKLRIVFFRDCFYTTVTRN